MLIKAATTTLHTLVTAAQRGAASDKAERARRAEHAYI